MKIIQFLLFILGCLLGEKLSFIVLSKAYARKCNYDCKKCGMWSCTNETDYENYKIIPYDNFKNVCGKEKNEYKRS